MLTIDWTKIDKFYIVLIFVLILLATMLIFTFRSVFSAYNTAYEIDPGVVGVPFKVDEEKFNEAYEWVFGEHEEN
jgi:hypothetical protein